MSLPLPKSCTPSITSPLYYTPLSQLSSTGTHSLGSNKIWFHRDRLRSATSVVELLHHRACSLLTLSTQAMGRWRKERWEEREREHRKISDMQLKLNRNIGHSRICFISHLRSPDFTNSSALPPNRRILAGFEPPVKNPFPCPNEMCWTSLFPLLCFFVFVYFSMHIYKKRRWDRIFFKWY